MIVVSLYLDEQSARVSSVLEKPTGSHNTTENRGYLRNGG